MSIEFVQSTVDGHPKVPAGVIVSCAESEGRYLVTLTRKHASANFYVSSSEAESHDSVAFEKRLTQRILDATMAIDRQLAPPKRRAPSKPKRKKRKAKKSHSVKMVDASPALQESVDKALEPVGE